MAVQTLVMVLPGIGGSVLAPPGLPHEPVWGGRLRDALTVLRHPERLDIGVDLEPVGLITTRTVFGFLTPIPGYEGLLMRLATGWGTALDDGSPSGRNLDAGVVAVGYDFRHSITRAADRLDDVVRERLHHLWPAGDHERRVVVVAHSMGGLVARHWLAEPDNALLCRRLVTLGTPFGGAPKALDVLANGLPTVGGVHLTGPRETMRGWPGAAELLPRYPAVIDDSPTSVDPSRATLYPHELDVGWLREIATRAYAVHRQGDAGWQTPGYHPEVIPRIGFGHGTARRCLWDGQRFTVTADHPQLDLPTGWDQDRGDGTVPIYCGLPRELFDADSVPTRLRVAQRHGPVIELDDVTSLSQGKAAKLAIHGDENPAVLGVDLEPLGVAGERFPVSARIIGSADVPETQQVWATVEAVDAPVNGSAPRFVRLDRAAGGEFVGELTPLPPGSYTVGVKAEGVPGAGDLVTRESVLVVDGAAA